MYVPGRLKGEDAREQAKRELRRIRDAFDAVSARSEGRDTEKADGEVRLADQREELKRFAASKARTATTKARSGSSKRKS
jgi:hypothetical protein